MVDSLKQKAFFLEPYLSRKWFWIIYFGITIGLGLVLAEYYFKFGVFA
jgi:hypothetical protein